jgi:tetratricopeptide (TPR) repeat protein
MQYVSQPDTGAVARAESVLAADPRNVEKIIALGVAQSGIRRYREAIATFTKGIAIAPDHALLYRWRGHRYLSLRLLDSAQADFTRGLKLDSTLYGIWYHKGVTHFVRGEFAAAADAFTHAQRSPPDTNELAGATDWLWMSAMRAGRPGEAAAALARVPQTLRVTSAAAYAQRIKLYRGEITPDQAFTPADTADIAVATLAYGVGNWYLLRGDTANAKAMFERSVRSGGWPAFGFIASEAELRRLK